VNVVEVLYTQTAAERHTRCKNFCVKANAKAVVFRDCGGTRNQPKSRIHKTDVNEKIAPFPNLSSAGRELAAALPSDLNNDVVVLALVSAGAPVAVEVARHLEASLDLIILRRLLAPRGPGSQAAAVNVAGTLVVDDEVGPRPDTPQTPFDYFLADALNGLARRVQVCRGERPPAELAGKAVLIVDCGIRTGLTMQGGINAVRKLNPAHITAAVPVTSLDGVRIIEPLADEFIYLAAPDPFGNAGVWYKDFSRPADDSIGQLLAPRPTAALPPG
jgi:putative phosphoribosyl transferase